MVVKLLVALPPLVTLLLLGRPSSTLYSPAVLQPTHRQPPSLSKVNYAIEYANPKPYQETTRKSNQDLMDAFWANVKLLKSLHSTMKTTAFVPTQKTTTNRPWMTGSLVQYFRSAPSYVVEQPPEAESPVIENESLIFPAPPSSESLPESRYIIEYANAPEDFATTDSPPGRNEQSSQAARSLAVSTARTRVPSLRSAMFVVVYRDKKKKDDVSAPASKSGNEINITLVATAAAVAERRGNRLPRSVVPQHYRVKLMPFISEGNFSTSGEVWILVRCDSPTQNITLNINDIGILENSVKVTEERRTGFMSRPSNWTGELGVMAHVYDTYDQTYKVLLRESLVRGREYTLNIKFLGTLNDLLQGFYRSSYVDHVTGELRWLASTQFSPTDARRAFPCFDEPEFKASFEMSVGRREQMVAISNMPVRYSEPVADMPGWMLDHFHPTLPMSSYLVALVVSDLEGLRVDSNGRLIFKVWSRRQAIGQTQYAGVIGPKILRHMENYYGIPFPLPKLDFVALPDFGFSAMENWGLILFREATMLHEDNISTHLSKQRVATVIGHELAHQWFGNLVTPQWWNDLWLKEGFATYVGNLGVQYVEPEWKMDQMFIKDTVQKALSLDALESSHPISVPVDNTNQIRQIFDEISYSKGACIVRMMSLFLGETTFKAGITNYLQAHKWGNAHQQNLWVSLTQRAHADHTLPTHVSVREIMETWTLQTGYPVVRVVRGFIPGTAVVSQERFYLLKEDGAGRRSKSKWWVPLTYTSQESPNFNSTIPVLWMENEESVVIDGLPDEKHWLLLNNQIAGFYRVNYDMFNWRLITHNIGTFPAVTRAQLFDDSLNLARAGLLDYSVPMNLAKTLGDEHEYLPWASALQGFGYLFHMLSSSRLYKDFRGFVLSLLERPFETLGFEEKTSDSQIDIVHRIQILENACSLDHPKCVSSAVSKYRGWMDRPSNNPISANQKQVVYCTAIKHGGLREWEFAWRQYSSTNVGSERETLLAALGCSRNLWILNRYLKMMMDESSGIRKQDGALVFTSVANTEKGNQIAFYFLRNNWKELLRYYGVAFSILSKMVAAIPVYMNTQDKFREMEQFWKQNSEKLGTAARSFQQAMETIQGNINWKNTSYHELEVWLSRNNKGLSTAA